MALSTFLLSSSMTSDIVGLPVDMPFFEPVICPALENAISETHRRSA
jgi:hypothetical protein